MGIEPTWPAWKAGALPLSYTRIGINTSCGTSVVNALNGPAKRSIMVDLIFTSSLANVTNRPSEYERALDAVNSNDNPEVCVEITFLPVFKEALLQPH